MELVVQVWQCARQCQLRLGAGGRKEGRKEGGREGRKEGRRQASVRKSRAFTWNGGKHVSTGSGVTPMCCHHSLLFDIWYACHLLKQLPSEFQCSISMRSVSPAASRGHSTTMVRPLFPARCVFRFPSQGENKIRILKDNSVFFWLNGKT